LPEIVCHPFIIVPTRRQREARFTERLRPAERGGRRSQDSRD
jgi:hypothetical protein